MKPPLLLRHNRTLMLRRLTSSRLVERTPLVMVGLVGATFLLAPWPLLTKLQATAFGICPQRLGHSFLLEGEPLPLEARMLGIFGGYALTTLYLLWAQGSQPVRFPPPSVSLLLLGFIGLMGADGLNAVAFDLQVPHLYPPTNEVRLGTGLLAGTALAAFLYPLVNLMVRGGPAGEPLMSHPRDLVKLAAFHGAFFLMVVLRAPFLYLVAILGILGLVAYVSVINLLFLGVVSERPSRTTASGFLGLGSWAVLLAAGEFATLAGLRLLLERVGFGAA